MNTNNEIHQDAQQIWNSLSQAKHNTIRRVCNESDLKFTVDEAKKVIASMKTKNSAGFDRVTNKMIKILPQSYVNLLADSYNTLFTEVYWGENWKQSRTVCFNKVDSHAPTTNQLRPISLLPIFGKIYERLFLLKFNV